MHQRFLRLIRIAFLVLDLVALNIVVIFAKNFFQKAISPDLELMYVHLHLLFNIGWVVASSMNSIYNSNNISIFEVFCRKTIRAYIYFVAIVMFYLFFLNQDQISRLFIVAVLAGALQAFLLNRLIHLVLFQFLLKKDHFIRRILIIGHNRTAKKLSQYLEEEPLKSKIIGFCEDKNKVKELTHYPVVGEIKNVMELSRKFKATDIYSTIAPEQNHEIYSFMKQADQECIHFKFIPDLDSFIRQAVHIDYLGQIPMFSIRKEPLDDLANRVRKRLYDLIFSTLVIVFILSWLVPILGFIIWLESGGPIFFIQKRTGVNMKPFNCIKFRSMKVNKDAHLKQASKGDPRITRLGRFLRKTNVDEFPQFFNVFKSDMSVVGPRPHMIKHTEDYSKLVNQYMVRQFLKPGITGWAQIKGCRGEIKTTGDVQNRLECDLWYLENWSLWLDTKIILLTVLNMIKGEKNAY